MNLVLKENPRGRLSRILNFSEKEAVLHVFSSGRKPGRADVILVDAILKEMEERDLLIECDCVSKSSNITAPYNCVVNRSSAKHIRHLSTSTEHDEQCPLHRVKKARNAENEKREGEISSLNPVGGNDWLPHSRIDAKVNPSGLPDEEQTHRRTALKPIPAIGRKLLTIIQAAGIHQRELVPNYRVQGLAAAIDSIKEVLNQNQMKNGVPLSDVFTCSPWLSLGKIAVMMSKLENNQEIKNKNKVPCIYIIGLANSVTAEEVQFEINKKPYKHSPVSRIKINGESTYNAGSRAPYWVIVEYRRDSKGKVYCHSGYAHSAYSKEDPIPVDSNLEKITLKTIFRACKYAETQNNCPTAISLNKPLFSLMTRVDDINVPIHPDFIIKIIPANGTSVSTLLIETMGSESKEYVDRKSRTHSMMEKEGTLLTDPPCWPHGSEKTFNKVLLSRIFNIGKK